LGTPPKARQGGDAAALRAGRQNQKVIAGGNEWPQAFDGAESMRLIQARDFASQLSQEAILWICVWGLGGDRRERA